MGAVVTSGEHILLCRRAINPRNGFWTLPAGFMELNESDEAGAMREAFEESTSEKIAIDQLLAAYTIPRLSQVQLIYRARLVDPAISAEAGESGSRPLHLGRNTVGRTGLSLGPMGVDAVQRGAGPHAFPGFQQSSR